MNFGDTLNMLAYAIVKQSEVAVLLRRNDGKKWMVMDNNYTYSFTIKKQAMDKFKTLNEKPNTQQNTGPRH